MKTLDFIKKIPMWINAREPEQLLYFLMKAYEDDLQDRTQAFKRDSDRFFILKTWKVKSFKGFLTKRHILNLLDIMNKKHKPDLLTDKDKIVLEKQIRKADKSRSARSTATGTQASAAYWEV